MKSFLSNSNKIHIVDEARFFELCNQGEVIQNGCEFLDGIKIALHLNQSILKAPNFIDTDKPNDSNWVTLNLNETILDNSSFYLAVSNEKISLSDRLMGLIHTRSRIARMGLDCVGSSNYVSPGFGDSEPTSIVIELRPRVNIKLSNKIPFASLILFEFEKPVRKGIGNQSRRFPLNLNIYNK